MLRLLPDRFLEWKSLKSKIKLHNIKLNLKTYIGTSSDMFSGCIKLGTWLLALIVQSEITYANKIRKRPFFPVDFRGFHQLGRGAGRLKKPGELLSFRPPTKNYSYYAGWSWFETIPDTRTDTVITSGMFSKWESRPLGCARSDLWVTSAFRQAAEDQSASGKRTVSRASVLLSDVLKWNLKHRSSYGEVNFFNFAIAVCCYTCVTSLSWFECVTCFEMATLKKVYCPLKSPAADPAYLDHKADSGDNILRKK